MFAIINEINMKTLLQFFIILFALSSYNPAFGQDLYTRDQPIECLNKKFSIVAHIVRDTFGLPNITEMTISENIERLNRDFEPMCVAFEICEFRYIDNFQYDTLDVDPNGLNEWEEMQVKYHEQNRINIFFATEIIINDPTFQCGFATQDGITQVHNGGIVMLKSCIDADSKAISHEMGHYFGLLNTFEGQGAELVDGSNCTTIGDLLCDTAADPFIAGQAPSSYVDVGLGCRFINQTLDANGEYYRPDVGNIMSNYQDECRCSFTNDQFAKMAEVCLNAPDKMW